MQKIIDKKGVDATGAIKAVDDAAIGSIQHLSLLPGIDTMDATLDPMHGVGDFTASILKL